MRIAVIGCGYVADFYLATLSNHVQLELTGVFDRNAKRLRQFSGYHKVRAYDSLDEILCDSSVDLVANLTNPSSHFAISKAALLAGKHVYSEKPLAMTLNDAQELVDLAAVQNRIITSAPCNVLGESAQTIWKSLRTQQIGRPRLAYLELDDGPVPFADYRTWISESGAPWPYEDEFEVGCTLEHAGYYLGMLLAFFGPAKRVTAFSYILMHEKQVPLKIQTPDFSVGCIEFESGVVARLTCSLYAPHDHRLRICGDDGILSTDAVWDYGSPVYLQKRTKVQIRLERYPNIAKLIGQGPRKTSLVRSANFRSGKGHNHMDFCRGMAEIADSIQERRPCRLSSDWALHMTEIVLAMQYPEAYGTPRTLTTKFAGMEPMSWAR